MTAPTIRPAIDADRAAVWAILEPIFRAGETYALDRDMTQADALAYWFAPDKRVFVAVDAGGAILGSYFLRANHAGGGAHVANCGYMTAPAATARGIGRAMCAHSLEQARTASFRAMQFNFVVASNTRAVALWQACGFAIVGTLPGAFAHPTLGEVDALVMHRRL